MRSGCGVYAGGKLGHGRDMLDLAPGAVATRWTAGKAASVGWSMIANHGGGYAYRCTFLSKEGGGGQSS